MSKAQVIEEILRCSPDVRIDDCVYFKEEVEKGLGQADMVSLEWVRDNIKASRTQQNKQKQKQINEMKCM